MACINCTKKSQDEVLQNILLEAKDYAIETGVAVAIYSEGYDYAFMRADIAIEQGYNIKTVVSKY